VKYLFWEKRKEKDRLCIDLRATFASVEKDTCSVAGSGRRRISDQWLTPLPNKAG
jgi:hypothetical protein